LHIYIVENVFPDSEVARKFSSARTKTEAIVNSVLASHSVKSVLKALEENDIAYCGVATDGSKHGLIKNIYNNNPVFQLKERRFGVKINQSAKHV
jgi:hypothetical protein